MNQTMVGQQLLQLVEMIAFGWCIMFTADEKKALSVCGKWSYLQKNIGDFLFCLLWGLLFWLFLMQINGGLLRNYIFIGLFAGCGLYYFVCRRYCYRLCTLLAKVVLFLWQWFCRILFFPWRVLKRLFLQPCSKLWKKFLESKQEFAGETENIIENENNFSR